MNYGVDPNVVRCGASNKVPLSSMPRMASTGFFSANSGPLYRGFGLIEVNTQWIMPKLSQFVRHIDHLDDLDTQALGRLQKGIAPVAARRDQRA